METTLVKAQDIIQQAIKEAEYALPAHPRTTAWCEKQCVGVFGHKEIFALPGVNDGRMFWIRPCAEDVIAEVDKHLDRKHLSWELAFRMGMVGFMGANTIDDMALKVILTTSRRPIKIAPNVYAFVKTLFMFDDLDRVSVTSNYNPPFPASRDVVFHEFVR